MTGGAASELLLIGRALLTDYSVGGRFDYRAASRSETFHAFQAAVLELDGFDPGELPDEAERRAWWINLYNALLIDMVIRFGVRRRIQEVRSVFDRAGYRVAGHLYSANDIEHGILRGNRRHPLSLRPPFGARDARRRQSLSLDPRVHFALVCAANSCPPIRYYGAGPLDTELDLAARAFINSDQVQIDRDQMQVRLSRIFYWYAPDFGGGRLGRERNALLSFVAPYVESDADRLFLLQESSRLSVRFLPYDWTLNAASA